MIDNNNWIPEKPIKDRPTADPSTEIQGNLAVEEKKIRTTSANSYEYSNDPMEQTNNVDSDVPMMYK